MTAKSALILALLEGRVLNIKNCFKEIGFTNCPREVSRMIEKPFGVEVSRTHRKGKNRYGGKVVWVDYRLNKSDHNLAGIEKMKAFVKKEAIKDKCIPENSVVARAYKQLGLF